MWFDNEWAVRHLPPKVEQRAPRFMQDVYRWYYERAKLAYANSQNDLNPVTAASLMRIRACGYPTSSMPA